MLPEGVRGTTTTHDKFGGDGPLQPLLHSDSRDDDIRLVGIPSQDIISALPHEFRQSSSAIGSQLRRHDIHRKLLWRAAEFTVRGGCVTEDFVAFIRSFSNGGRSTGLGIGVVDVGSCPPEGGHGDVGKSWVRGTSISSFIYAATLCGFTEDVTRNQTQSQWGDGIESSADGGDPLALPITR